MNIGTTEFDRVILVTVDCLRWDYHEQYRDLYPNGYWFRGTAPATYTASSHAAMFSGCHINRHGVYDFGDIISTPTLFDFCDGISLSAITNDETYVLPLDTVETVDSSLTFYGVDEEKDDTTWQTGLPSVVEVGLDKIAEHDLSFVHDWVVHASGPSHDEDWSMTISESEHQQSNHNKYRHHIDLSIKGHRRFLDELKNNGLYEDTLFMLWCDHGQGLNQPPFNHIGHSNRPNVEQVQVPIAFCSPKFDTTETNRTLNPGGVDILPTLDDITDIVNVPDTVAVDGISIDGASGERAQYAHGFNTYLTGTNDATYRHDYAYMAHEVSEFYDLHTDDELCAETACDEPPMAEQLTDKYRDVRQREFVERDGNPTNREFLENMGYI